jgi:hypothetical protein
MILQFVLYESGTGDVAVKEENMLRVFEGKRSEEIFKLKEREAEYVDVMVTL